MSENQSLDSGKSRESNDNSSQDEQTKNDSEGIVSKNSEITTLLDSFERISKTVVEFLGKSISVDKEGEAEEKRGIFFCMEEAMGEFLDRMEKKVMAAFELSSNTLDSEKLKDFVYFHFALNQKEETSLFVEKCTAIPDITKPQFTELLEKEGVLLVMLQMYLLGLRFDVTPVVGNPFEESKHTCLEGTSPNITSLLCPALFCPRGDRIARKAMVHCGIVGAEEVEGEDEDDIDALILAEERSQVKQADGALKKREEYLAKEEDELKRKEDALKLFEKELNRKKPSEEIKLKAVKRKVKQMEDEIKVVARNRKTRIKKVKKKKKVIKIVKKKKKGKKKVKPAQEKEEEVKPLEQPERKEGEETPTEELISTIDVSGCELFDLKLDDEVGVGELTACPFTNTEVVKEFMGLEDKFSSVDKRHFSIASTPKNKLKNRYSNILPYNHNVVITRSGYMNASDFQLNNFRYIACQWPLKNCGLDFWSTMFDYNVRVIINLQAPKPPKHHYYWPSQYNKPMDVGKGYFVTPVHIVKGDVFDIYKCRVERKAWEATKKVMKGSMKSIAPKSDPTAALKSLHPLAKKMEEKAPREIVLLVYKKWPDHGIPDEYASLFELIKYSDKINMGKKEEPKVPITTTTTPQSTPPPPPPPMVVHCSAGIGRTGVFILAHNILNMKNGNSKMIRDVLYKMRRQRKGMIQTHTQYKFAYDFIWKYTENQKKEGL